MSIRVRWHSRFSQSVILTIGNFVRFIDDVLHSTHFPIRINDVDWRPNEIRLLTMIAQCCHFDQLLSLHFTVSSDIYVSLNTDMPFFYMYDYSGFVIPYAFKLKLFHWIMLFTHFFLDVCICIYKFSIWILWLTHNSDTIAVFCCLLTFKVLYLRIDIFFRYILFMSSLIVCHNAFTQTHQFPRCYWIRYYNGFVFAFAGDFFF